MQSEDLVKLNEILDKLTVNRFIEYYSELRDYSYTVDPATGEIVPINDIDKVYFDKMTL
jgi:hypothetical protein